MKVTYLRYWMKQLGEITPALNVGDDVFESARIRHYYFRWYEAHSRLTVWLCNDKHSSNSMSPVASLTKTLKHILHGIRLVCHGNEYIEVNIVPEIKGRSFFYGKVVVYKRKTNTESFCNGPITEFIHDPEFVGLMIEAHKLALNIPLILDWLEDNSSQKDSIKKLREGKYHVRKPLY